METTFQWPEPRWPAEAVSGVPRGLYNSQRGTQTPSVAVNGVALRLLR